VFSRDEHGDHTVETLLARTDLADRLELSEWETGVRIEVDGAGAEGGAGSRELCGAAVRGFLEAAFEGSRSTPGIRIRLTKRIPPSRGLGGASADAAGTLRLLWERWPDLEAHVLFDLAGRLGSDVLFGLLDVPMALGWEHGRRLLPLRPPRPRPAILCCPPFGVSKRSAYGWLQESRDADPSPAGAGGASVLPGATRLAEWGPTESLIHNDLEGPVATRHADVKRALAVLRGVSSGAAMTGSGSGLFALLSGEKERKVVRDAMRVAGFGSAEGWRLLNVTLPR